MEVGFNIKKLGRVSRSNEFFRPLQAVFIFGVKMDEDERTRRLKEVFGFPGDQIAMRKLGEVFADDIYQAMNRPGVLASLFKVEEMPKEDQEKLWKQLESKLEQYND